MTTFGLEVIPGNDMTRIRAVCDHQSGLIYVVPAERSWVCDQEYMPAHALAGFFSDLTSLENDEKSPGAVSGILNAERPAETGGDGLELNVAEDGALPSQYTRHEEANQ